jgi:hypothetical protein
MDKQSADFSDRDIFVAILNAVLALADRLGGGRLTVKLASENTGHAVDVHADGAAFGPTAAEGSAPSVAVRAALAPKQK